MTVTLPQADSGVGGKVTIDRKVYQKVAAQAASEVPAATEPGGGLRGLVGQSATRGRPDISVDIQGSRAVITVRCGITYPTPLRETAETLRKHVASQLTRQTGLRVDRVDIEIVRLSRDAGRSNRPK